MRLSGMMLARVLVLGAIAAFGGFLWLACEPAAPLRTRILSGVAAAFCLALPVRMLYVGTRRYSRTGSWGISPEERAIWRKRVADNPTNPWVQQVLNAVLIAAAVLQICALALKEYHHQEPVWNAILLWFWAIFLVRQTRALWTELRAHRTKLAGA